MTREEAAKVLEKQFDESCGDYRYQNKDKLDYEDALWLAIAALREQMEWISVKDRLPDDEQEVLVIAHGWDGRLVYVGSHKRVESQKSWLTGITNKSSEWSLWGWSYLKEPMVTYWMPLPEPPETLIKEGDYEKQGVI